MSVSLLTVSKVVVSLGSLTKDSPLKELSKNEFNMALYILKLANSEQSICEAINRAFLSLLEIWNRDKFLDTRTYANFLYDFFGIYNSHL